MMSVINWSVESTLLFMLDKKKIIFYWEGNFIKSVSDKRHSFFSSKTLSFNPGQDMTLSSKLSIQKQVKHTHNNRPVRILMSFSLENDTNKKTGHKIQIVQNTTWLNWNWISHWICCSSMCSKLQADTMHTRDVSTYNTDVKDKLMPYYDIIWKDV